MKKPILYVASLATIGMLLCAFIVMKHPGSLVIVYSILAVSLATICTVVVLRQTVGFSLARTRSVNRNKTAIKIFLVIFGVGAVNGLVGALEEGWKISDTVGACLWCVITTLLVREYFRKI